MTSARHDLKRPLNKPLNITLNLPFNKLSAALCSVALMISAQAFALPQMAAANNAKTTSGQSTDAQSTCGKCVTKPVIYQVFTRLFGNTQTANIPWGTKAQNGVGKMSDFTPKALESIKSLGVSHIWYTGIPHHALVGDYSEYGIGNDDPDAVKGRAGSPYAVKDYYNVNPDLADDPAKRLEEFEALIARTHEAGMQVIIDIVPNHVARGYHSLSAPKGVTDFGASDNTQVSYARDNNFYYVVDTPFEVPSLSPDLKPLGGESHPLVDGKFDEFPAKWTGNGARAAKPDQNDWYETVKINYGVKPDGSADYPQLPVGYSSKSAAEHYAFWQQVPKDSIPSSWLKFNEIAQYWLAKGVDGFRYDMAEMVPVAFWSYLNSHIKQTNPDALLLAEVYTPSRYRDYIHLGKMDYLYDKVGLYDSLKAIIQGKAGTQAIERDRDSVEDIAAHMLHFLENHDEQRIASPEFAGDPKSALPAMVISTTLSQAPTLLYFGQEVGEDGSEDAGFGKPSRTSIFDYVGVPAHQRFMNMGKFDGGQSSKEELSLRAYYAKLLNLSHSLSALSGKYGDLHTANIAQDKGYDADLFAFSRFDDKQRLIIVSNFAKDKAKHLTLELPPALVKRWQLAPGTYPLREMLSDEKPKTPLTLTTNGGQVTLDLAPLESKVLVVGEK
ncbi:alpha-amylase family protein [Shewanella insulae]|uniref:alpha-amylase family protein n=1 Tax=Shewanella insulae TaxID=2681496 RepID=UPI001EFE11FF|nr:alpha-amylase family protein [Shewanella insulae]MCG9755580.1 alpha-amylase family protein [Shewanella insulae]